jgi:predicted dehydrogenase
LPHDVGIARHVCRSRVTDVSATVDADNKNATIVMTLASGCIATVRYGYRDKMKRREIRLGTGGIDVEFDGFQTLSTYGNDGATHENPIGPEPLDAMCAEFVDCCKTGRAPRYGNVDDALAVAAVIEAAHKSVSERRVVAL